MTLRIHPRASAETVAAARILVGLLWLGRLLFDPIHRLGYFPPDLWYAQGVMRLIPVGIMEALLDPVALSGLRIVALALAALVVLGVRPHRLTLIVFTVVLTIYLGIGRGFGAHVNHRELVLLYVTGLLILLPCFDAFAVQPRSDDHQREAPYRASMIAIALVIVLNYMFVGVARLAIGFPTVFDPDVMRGWLVSRSLRPQPLGLDITGAILRSTFSTWLISLMLPVSTILEVLAPSVLWLRQRWRVVLVGALAAMHVMIALLMNIVFVENAVLLVLLLDYTPVMERWRSGSFQW